MIANLRIPTSFLYKKGKMLICLCSYIIFSQVYLWKSWMLFLIVHYVISLHVKDFVTNYYNIYFWLQFIWFCPDNMNVIDCTHRRWCLGHLDQHPCLVSHKNILLRLENMIDFGGQKMPYQGFIWGAIYI